METVAIIGGGFSGTALAVNLARLSRQALHICLINSGYPTGRGIAYGTKRPEHLLNVVARNMSAFADQPSHFVDWLKTRSEYGEFNEADLREQFIPRRVYGDYIQSLLHLVAGSHNKIKLERYDLQAVGLEDGGNRGTVLLEDGKRLEADRVALAIGNRQPADLPLAKGKFEHPAYCNNPWQTWETSLPARTEPVIIIGTGLTAIDAYLTLEEMRWRGPIYAVSRSGLLPLSHFKGIDYPGFPPADPSNLSLAQLKAIMDEHCALLRQEGQNPAIVVDRLRPYTQRIWQNFTLQDKHLFYRSYRQRWNITRHRIAQSIHARLSAADAEGRLQLVKGRVKELDAKDERIVVTVDDDSGRGCKEIVAGFVINCTGPCESYLRNPSPLFADLAAKGLAIADAVDLGIQVAPNFALHGRTGLPSTWLFGIGPMLKGTLWETTAVPELRVQAHQVAETFLADLEGRTQTAAPVGNWNVDLIEYCI